MVNEPEKLMVVNKTIKANSDHYAIIGLGDLHVGHDCCDEDAINDMVKWISEKDKAQVGVVLTGDLIENVLPTTKGSLFEMKYPSPQKQLDVVCDMLRPIAGHILMMCDGNHENRTSNNSGIIVSKIISKELKIPYVGYHGILNLNLVNRNKKVNYVAYAEHGCGAIPRSVGGRYNRLTSIQSQVEADIYLKGHIHHKLVFDKRVWKFRNGKMEKRKIIFASNGSYLMDAEYAIRSGFEPTNHGVAKVLLSTKEFNIHCNI